MADASSFLQNAAQIWQRGGAVTASGVPVEPAQSASRSTNSGDTSWQDNLFSGLMNMGSGFLQYTLQKDAIKTSAELQAQYGTLYTSPGSFFPTTNGQGVTIPVNNIAYNPMMLMMLAAFGVGLFILLKD